MNDNLDRKQNELEVAEMNLYAINRFQMIRKKDLIWMLLSGISVLEWQL